jgi:hypothetical protein
VALDRTNGEVVEGLGHNYKVVPTDKWATTQYGAPHFLEAHKAATLAFKGAIGKFANPEEMLPLGRNDVIVQEYWLLGKVAFIFEKKIGNDEYVYAYVFDIDPRLIEALRLSGEWDIPIFH